MTVGDRPLCVPIFTTLDTPVTLSRVSVCVATLNRVSAHTHSASRRRHTALGPHHGPVGPHTTKGTAY